MFDEAQVQQSAEKVCRVPDSFREFRIDPGDAERRFAIKESLLAELLDLGLPYRRQGGECHFDFHDLLNISLDLRLPGVQWRFMRLWPRSLRTARRNGNVPYRFTVRAACPLIGHLGPCDFKVNQKFEENTRLKTISARVFQFQGNLVSEAYDFGDSIEPIIAEARRLQFHAMPNPANYDMKFLNDSGLATCQSAAVWLTQVAARHGIDARPANGLFVSVPYSVQHVWLEIRVGDEWKHADPFFLNSLARWELIRLADWPLTRSPQFAVFPMASGVLLDEPLIWDAGSPAHWGAIETTVISGAAGSSIEWADDELGTCAG